MKKTLVCTQCGSIDSVKKITPGSFAIEIVLWLCFLIPGLIYSLWRLAARRKGCGVCGSAALVPAASPMGRKITSQH